MPRCNICIAFPSYTYIEEKAFLCYSIDLSVYYCMRRRVQIIVTVAGILCIIAARKAEALVSIDVPTNFAGFSSQDLKTTVGNLVSVIVGFLGTFLILLIFFGGLLWMTSGGNEDKIASAKRLIASGVVGMVIILMSYSIAGFLASSLSQAV